MKVLKCLSRRDLADATLGSVVALCVFRRRWLLKKAPSLGPALRQLTAPRATGRTDAPPPLPSLAAAAAAVTELRAQIAEGLRALIDTPHRVNAEVCMHLKALCSLATLGGISLGAAELELAYEVTLRPRYGGMVPLATPTHSLKRCQVYDKGLSH